jgi:hypothetical protein
MEDDVEPETESPRMKRPSVAELCTSFDPGTLLIENGLPLPGSPKYRALLYAPYKESGSEFCDIVTSFSRSQDH